MSVEFNKLSINLHGRPPSWCGAALPPLGDHRDGADQPAGVVMVRPGEDRFRLARLRPACPSRTPPHGRRCCGPPTVVGDEDIGQAALCPQFIAAAQHARLDQHVERRGRLVEDDDLRLAGQRPRDRDPLPLPAGKRGRGAGANSAAGPTSSSRAADPRDSRPFLSPMSWTSRASRSDAPIVRCGIERRQRVLLHELDHRARCGSVAVAGQQIAVEKMISPRARRINAEDHVGECALARTAIRRRPQGIRPRLTIERDVVDARAPRACRSQTSWTRCGVCRSGISTVVPARRLPPRAR